MDKKNDWHSIELEEVYQKLQTSDLGLSDAESKKRIKEFGHNEISEAEIVSWISILFAQLKNPLIYVLIAAITLSIFVGKYIDATVIGLVVVLNTVIGFIQEYRAEESLAALRSLSSPEAEVSRECPEIGLCIETRVKTRELVPGDILLLQAGTRVPADARLIDAINLETIDSMLTGESIPILKNTSTLSESTPLADRKNMVYSGTIVAQGRGRGIIVATGMQTEIGKIATLLSETSKAETPLKRRIGDLGNKLGIMALSASLIVFIIGWSRGFDVFELFLFTLATAVSAIPEGLPTVITITLSIGVNRMAKRNAVIRRLQAVETLGSATAICTDKTGTLTTNQMTVKKIYQDDNYIEVTGAGYQPIGSFIKEGKKLDVKETLIKKILRSAALCNDAKIRRIEGDGVDKWDIIGDPTEGALIVVAEKAGLDKYALEKVSPRIDEIPFDSKSKYMVTFHREEEGQVSINMKGAPEIVLNLCEKIEKSDQKILLDLETKQKIIEINQEMASQALRVLAIASGTIAANQLTRAKKKIIDGEKFLVFQGLLGLIDPPRPEVKESIALCKRAGIRVVMATGDQKLTAEAIAKELGIIEPNEKVVEGQEIDTLNDVALLEIVKNTSAFARVSPNHKVRIVESLRTQGHVVAMTGDGVNDAPALKSAEIGIAMGISGTDVTKEAADMVLTDDNFTSIVAAIEEGRVVFENIRKTIKFLISTNTGEIVVLIAALLLFPNAPPLLLPVQILWINLVTDSILTIPLALEPKEKDVMDQKPRDRNENLINKDVLRLILWFGTLMMVGTLTLYYINLYDIIKAQTMAFACIAFFQIFNSLNCRSQNKSIFTLGLTTNKYLLLAVGITIILQILAINTTLFNSLLRTTPLGIIDWFEVIIVSSTIFFVEEVRKSITNRFTLKM